MNIKTEEKIIGEKKNFWTPLPEKTGTGKEKNAKMTNFRPKKVQNMTKKISYSNFS